MRYFTGHMFLKSQLFLWLYQSIIAMYSLLTHISTTYATIQILFGITWIFFIVLKNGLHHFKA